MADSATDRLPVSEKDRHPYRDLLERLRAATRPDRNLSDDVLFATGHRYSMAFLSSTGWRWKGVNLTEREVCVTASLDAALALVERLRPGAPWRIGREGTEKFAAWVTFDANERPSFSYTPALAILIALLAALSDGSPLATTEQPIPVNGRNQT